MMASPDDQPTVRYTVKELVAKVEAKVDLILQAQQGFLSFKEEATRDIKELRTDVDELKSDKKRSLSLKTMILPAIAILVNLGYTTFEIVAKLHGG